MFTIRVGKVTLFLPLLAVICGAAAGGAPPTWMQADETWIETEIVRESFSDDKWRDRWAVEGNAESSVGAGRLSVVTSQATIWWRKPLTADVLIELKAHGQSAVSLPAIV